MAKNILKATSVVLVMNLVVKLLGFLRETSLANAFGAGPLSDAYLSAYTIPYFLQAILGYALVTAVVPILTKHLVAGHKDEASYVGSAIINLTAVALAGVTLLGIIVCDWLVKLLAPGYGPEQAALTANLARIMFPSVVFMGVGMVLTGICNAHYRFAVSAFAPGMSNIIIIVSLLFFSAAYGIFGAAWGTLLSFVGFFVVAGWFQISPGAGFAAPRRAPAAAGDWPDCFGRGGEPNLLCRQPDFRLWPGGGHHFQY